jgi:hypothetical protein
MARGESTKRSSLDAEQLTEKLRHRGAEILADEEEVWAVVDPSELRKPYARQMPDLMRVRKTGSERGTVPGYRTLNVLGIGRNGRRGVLYHRLFSSHAEGFASESREIQTALETVGKALVGKRVTYLMDSQFDDEAVWSTIWTQGNHLVCRLKHAERIVELRGEDEGWKAGTIQTAKGQARELARVRTEMLVRKASQPRTKRQPVAARISSCPIRVSYPLDVRRKEKSRRLIKEVFLVVVELENVGLEPWLLITDHPVRNEEEAALVFRMYRMRWAVEDCFKYTKDVLGWEDVQLMELEAVRTLVALGWVAAGFLYELGVTLEWPEVQLLARLGGWTPRPDRPPGKTILSRGLQRLLDHLATEAILAEEIRIHGALPPRIAAFLGPNWQPTLPR